MIAMDYLGQKENLSFSGPVSGAWTPHDNSHLKSHVASEKHQYKGPLGQLWAPVVSFAHWS